MAFEFRLPDIGEGTVEGEVVRWLVKVGETVRADQPMVEVMTDKATVEIPTPRAGRILSIEVPDGKVAKVGQVLVRIDTDPSGAAAASAAAPEVKVPPAAAAASHGPAPAAAVHLPAPTAPAAGAAGRVLATPATRKLGRDLGVDLRLVPPTGQNGRVTSNDVRAFVERRAAPAAVAVAEQKTVARDPEPAFFQGGPPTLDLAVVGDERVPFRGVRKKIADNMLKSRLQTASFTYVEEADLTELVALRARARKRAEERGVKLSYLPFIIKACVAGLKKFPIVNSMLDEERGEIVLRKRYHVGIAAAAQHGLIVPVVKDADKKSIFTLAREIDDVTSRAKDGRAARDELSGSTFTISSLGALGGVLATPIINTPEVAVLGVHKIKQAPVVRDGQIVIREIANFSITLDHRIVDGYEGAMFLQHVVSLLEDPTLLFMELV